MAIAALAIPALLAAGSAASAAGAGAIGATTAALSAAGAAASAAGSISSGLYSAQVAKNNARIAQNNQASAVEAGNVQSEQQGLKDASEIGQLKADQAANQVDVNSGSALAVRQSADAAGQLDQQTILHNALLQAYGYQQTAVSDNAQANQDATAGYEQAAGGLLQNASAISYKWSNPFGGPASGAAASGAAGAGGNANSNYGVTSAGYVPTLPGG